MGSFYGTKQVDKANIKNMAKKYTLTTPQKIDRYCGYI